MGQVVYAKTATEDAVIGGHNRGEARSDQQPRIPLIGVDAGCIPGTRPGCSARELERAGRDLVRARLSRRRFKPA